MYFFSFSILLLASFRVLFFIPLLDVKLMKSTRKLLLDLKKYIYDVHGDLASRITEVHEILRRIENHGNRIGESEEIVDAPPVSPRVPDYLEARFVAAIEATNPELRDQASFPLAQGINAFHHHFEQVRSLDIKCLQTTKLTLKEHIQISSGEYITSR